MRTTRFYFHDFKADDDSVDNQKIIEIFKKIKLETAQKDKAPIYVEIDDSKLHIQIMNIEEQKNDHNEDECIFFGKLIQSHKVTDFKEENKGELIDIEIDEDSGICQPERGVIYFIFYINKVKNERLLMVEDVPFALNIGGITQYLNVRLELLKGQIWTKQKLGRDIIPIITATGNSEITLARIRFKKNITIEDVKKFGVVEKAIEELKNQELDCEIVIHWSRSNKQKLNEFIKKLLKIDNIPDITKVDFGSFLRTLYFEIDNSAHPKINMKDDIIKYAPPQNKDYYLEHEEELYNCLKIDFMQKRNEGKLNG